MACPEYARAGTCWILAGTCAGRQTPRHRHSKARVVYTSRLFRISRIDNAGARSPHHRDKLSALLAQYLQAFEYIHDVVINEPTLIHVRERMSQHFTSFAGQDGNGRGHGRRLLSYIFIKCDQGRRVPDIGLLNHSVNFLHCEELHFQVTHFIGGERP